MGAIAYQITSLTIPYSIVSVSNHQPHDSLLNRYSDAAQKNIKAPHHWNLCGEFTADQWTLRTNGQLRGKCFHLTTSSWPNVSCLRQDWESEVGHSDLILVKLGTQYVVQTTVYIPIIKLKSPSIMDKRNQYGAKRLTKEVFVPSDKTFEQVLSVSCKNGWEGEP